MVAILVSRHVPILDNGETGLMDLGSVQAIPINLIETFCCRAGQFIFSTWARAQAREWGGGWARRAQAVEDFGSLLNVATA